MALEEFKHNPADHSFASPVREVSPIASIHVMLECYHVGLYAPSDSERKKWKHKKNSINSPVSNLSVNFFANWSRGPGLILAIP